MKYPRIIAHRCGGALAPENTLAGLVLAARLGCGGVEFDAMLSADGLPFVIHDETLERTTNGSGPVREQPAEVLHRLDAGSHHHKAYAGEPLPSLQRALALCATLDLWANVEIKPAQGFDIATGRCVAQVVADSPARAKVLLSSFSEIALAGAREVAPDLPRALLVEAVPEDWAERMAQVGACALHFAAREATLDVMVALRAAQVPFACYTVNRRDDGNFLLGAGAAAIFTDRPDLWTATEMSAP